MRPGFGFHSKCGGCCERFASRRVAASNFDFDRLVLAIVPGKDSRRYWQKQGDHFGGDCNHLGERFRQLRPE